jgi:hypothetical protein
MLAAVGFGWIARANAREDFRFPSQNLGLRVVDSSWRRAAEQQLNQQRN